MLSCMFGSLSLYYQNLVVLTNIYGLAAARKYKKELSFWRKHGQAKITLKIDSEEQMFIN